MEAVGLMKNAENSDLCWRVRKEFAKFANSLLCNVLYINNIK